MPDNLTPGKAKMILRDRKVHGHPISEAQRKYFGLIASGKKPKKKKKHE